MTRQDIDNFVKRVNSLNESLLSQIGSSKKDIVDKHNKKQIPALIAIIRKYNSYSFEETKELMEEDNPWAKKDYSNL